MRDLVDARIGLAASLARLASIDEIIESEYLAGRLDRRHALQMQRMQYQTEEARAEAELLQVLQVRERLRPSPPHHSTSSSGGITPQEFEAVAQQLPEMKPETIRTLSQLLSALLAEKKP